MAFTKKMTLAEFLILAKISGLNPKSRSAFAKIRFAIFFIMCAYSCMSAVHGSVSFKDSTEFVDSVEMSSTYCQVCVKSLLFVIKMPGWRRIIEDLETFWPWNKYGRRAEKSVRTTQLYVRNFVKIYFICTLITIEYFNLLKAPNGSYLTMQESAINVCDLSSKCCYWFLIAFSIFASHVLVIVMAAVDCVFIAVVVYCYCELKLLRAALQNLTNILDDEENFLEFRNIVQHHVKVLNVLKRLNSLISFSMFCQFATSTFTICIELFVINFSNDFVEVINKALIMSCFLCEMGMFCTIGSIISAECETFANYYYDIDWWCPNMKRYRKCIVNVIQQSQKPVHLTIGGMTNLNLDTFREVLKLCMSILTFLKTMLIKPE